MEKEKRIYPRTIWFRGPTARPSEDPANSTLVNYYGPDSFEYGKGEWLTRQTFFKKISSLRKRVIFIEHNFCPRQGDIYLEFDDKYFHSSLFSFVFSNQNECEEFAEEELKASRSMYRELATQIIDGVKTIKECPFFKPDQSYSEINTKIQNSLSLKDPLHSPEYYDDLLECLIKFANIFGKGELALFLKKSFKRLRQEIQKICNDIIWIDKKEGRSELEKEHNDLQMRIFESYYECVAETRLAEGKSKEELFKDWKAEQHSKSSLMDAIYEKKENLIHNLGFLLSIADYLGAPPCFGFIKREGKDKASLEDKIQQAYRVFSEKLYTVFKDNIVNKPYGKLYFSAVETMLAEVMTNKNCYERLLPEQKTIIKKFYHLSLYFGGNIQDLLGLSFGAFDNNCVLDCYKGFESNAQDLSDIAYEKIKKYITWEGAFDLIGARDHRRYGKGYPVLGWERDVLDAFEGTQVKKNRLLETSYFLSEFNQYSPLFEGMEYTPILVNLYKTVEIFICDLFDKLGLPEAKTTDRNPFLTMFIEEGECWRDSKDATMNGKEGLIAHIEKLNYLNKKIDKKREPKDPNHLVDENGLDLPFDLYTYDQKMKAGGKTNLVAKMTKFQDDYKDKFHIDFQKIGPSEEEIFPSDLLSDLLKEWTRRCRNANLHKHTTRDGNDEKLNDDCKESATAKEKLDFTFEFTSLVIATLIEWFRLIKGRSVAEIHK